MKVSFESSYKPHQSGSYNPPTAAVIMEHGVQFLHHGVKNQHWGIKNGPPYPLTGENKQKAKASYKKPPKNPEKDGDYKPKSSSSSGGGGGSSKSTKETKERKDDKPTVSANSKKANEARWKNTEKEYFKALEEYNKIDDAIRKERDDIFDKEIRKNFGTDVETLKQQLYKESRDINNGKLRYEKSTWAKYNPIHDKIYGDSWDGSGGYKRKEMDQALKDHEKKVQDIFDKHLDDMAKNGVKMHVDNLGTKKKYDPEHEDYYDYDKGWFMDNIDKSSKYDVDWDTGEIRRRKK